MNIWSATPLRGHSAIVTGASHGLGRAFAGALGQAGAAVYVNGRGAGAVDVAVASLIAEGVDAVAHPGDVGRSGFMDDFVHRVVQERGSVEILVNNAAVNRPALLDETVDDDWDDVIRVDLTGVFFGIRAAVRAMRPHGYGRIISVTSTAGIDGSPFQTAYSAAKAGVIGLTKSVARQVAGTGITVNAISPIALTAMARSVLTDAEAQSAAECRVPMQRFASAEEVAPALVTLALPHMSYTTGHVLLADGGMSM